MKNFQDYKEFYKNIKEVFCPYLQKNIRFNAKGWGHFIRKGGIGRPSKDIFRRLAQLENVITIISKAHLVQEKEIIIQDEKGIIFLGFVGIVGESKIKVIVKSDNVEDYYFYSVMTDYKTRVSRE